ncbi:MAG: hypothetical protein EOO80_19720 [Oxalobacteraceae bacterium]|nr:MAG: hypothetical protein EOO80_19720 [Oxalobacteraceae bacterium]
MPRSAHNIIPDKATLRGTIRTLSPGNRAAAQEAITTLANGIAAAHDMTAQVSFVRGFPPTINDGRAVDLGARVAIELADNDQAAFLRMDHPIMGAEDFSYVLEKVPGAMFFLGVAQQGSDWSQCCGLHSSRMIVDETVLPRGAAFLAGCATRFLANGWE